MGAAGSGKSRLGLGLIQFGAILVGDDRVWVGASAQGLLVWPVNELAGLIEIRGWGPVRLISRSPVPVRLAVWLYDEPSAAPRWPEAQDEDATLDLAGVRVPLMAVPAGGGDATAAQVATALQASRYRP